MKEYENLKDWVKQALYLNRVEQMSGAAISRKIGVPARTVQENLKRYAEIVPDSAIIKPDKVDCPKILFHDIETSLAVSFHFGQWQQNLSIKQQVHESHLLSHSWSWGDGEVHGSILTQEEVLDRNDERIVLELWHLLDECDIYVAHNGKKFDVKKANGFFLKYGLPPPSPYKVVDTLLISRRKFGLPFHNLAYLAKFLNVTRKIDNSGIELWIDCAFGKQHALDEMLEYNIGDIVTLREVYYKIIGWENDAVNMSLYSPTYGLRCPHCSSADVSKIQGKYTYTAQMRYHVYRCNSCKAVLRGGTSSGEDTKLYRIVN